MPKRDLTFEIIRLLSQRIVSDNKTYPEGHIMQKTSCMNPDDAELIGFLEATKLYLDQTTDTALITELENTASFFERIGLARWIKGELTHLGLRAGLKYLEQIDLSEQAIDDTVDEVSLASDAVE